MDNYANTFSRGRCTNICVGGNNPLVSIAVQFSLRGHANATLTSKKEHSSIKIGCLKKIVTTWKFLTLHSHPPCLPYMFEVAIPSGSMYANHSSHGVYSKRICFQYLPCQQHHLGLRGIATLSTTRQIQDLDMWRLREQQESYYWLLLGWPCCVWIVYRYLSFSNCHHRYHHFSCPIDENWCISAEKWYLNHLQNAVGIRFHRLSTPLSLGSSRRAKDQGQRKGVPKNNLSSACSKLLVDHFCNHFSDVTMNFVIVGWSGNMVVVNLIRVDHSSICIVLFVCPVLIWQCNFDVDIKKGKLWNSNLETFGNLECSIYMYT